MLQSLQFHLVGFCPLAGQDVLPLEVGVHHHDDGGVIVQFPDNDGDGVQPCQFCGVVAAVAGDDLIPAVLVRAHDEGIGNAHLPDALYGLRHSIVIQHLEGMPFKGVQLGEGHPLDGLRHGLSRCLRLFFLCSWHLCSPRFLNVGLWEKEKRRVPSPLDGAGYTPMYQSVDTKKERIPTAGFLRQRYPLYEALFYCTSGRPTLLAPPCAFVILCFGSKNRTNITKSRVFRAF